MCVSELKTGHCDIEDSSPSYTPNGLWKSTLPGGSSSIEILYLWGDCKSLHTDQNEFVIKSDPNKTLPFQASAYNERRYCQLFPYEGKLHSSQNWDSNC